MKTINKSKKYSLLILFFILVTMALAVSTNAEITTQKLPDAMQYVPYGFKLEADGEGKFSMYGTQEGKSSFPKGLKVSSNGNIFGVPEKEGTYELIIAQTIKGKDYVKTLTLKVLPFDKSLLNQGGKDTEALASSGSLKGNANILNGGSMASFEGSIHLINKKGYYMRYAPGDSRAKNRFSAPKYAFLNEFDGGILFFNSYIESKKLNLSALGAVKGIKDLKNAKLKYDLNYTNRILIQEEGKKRKPILNITSKDMTNLQVHNKDFYYLMGTKKAKSLYTSSIEKPRQRELLFFYNERPIQVESFILSNGKIFFKAKDGFIYSAFLDGNIATRVLDKKSKLYCLAGSVEKTYIAYTDAKNQLYIHDIEKNESIKIKGVFAGALNAGEGELYFSNLKKKSSLYSLKLDEKALAEAKEGKTGKATLEASLESSEIAKLPVGKIFVFDKYIGFKHKKTGGMYLMSEGSQKPLLLAK